MSVEAASPKLNGFRSGYVALAGRPNAGKSTLLNALVREKIAITAPQPQTTRSSIQGIVTTEHMQVVLLDTPGIHDARGVLQKHMMQDVHEALNNSDVVLLLADSTRKPQDEDGRIVQIIRRDRKPNFLLLTKSDLLPDKRALLPMIDWYTKQAAFTEVFPISAYTGDGISSLVSGIEAALPEGQALFPSDFVTTQPLRFMAAEIVREKILRETREEVPHAAAVIVEQWEEKGNLVVISAEIYVERKGQRTILLGTKGEMLKKIGTAARLDLEELLGRKVHLSLFVKIRPRWREDSRFVKTLDWQTMLGSDTKL